MKAVTSAADANGKSQENLANQSQVLTEQLSLQEKRIEEIQKALDHARSNYAENSNQVQRWQQAMNNARGKDHLTGTGTPQGTGAATVPADEMRAFKLFNPTATEAEITAWYNKHKK